MPEITASTRGLMVGSYLVGALALVARAAGTLVDPQAAGAHASAFITLPLLAGYATVLGASVAFLLMQTERSDFTAKQLASTDPLTGAYNRQYMSERIATEIAYAVRHRTNLSVILFDLDHFEWTPYDDPLQALVWSVSPASIAQTWVDGRPLYRDGAVVTIDERELHVEARERAAAIVRRAGLDREGTPVTTTLYDE